ncbi:bifunctional 5,10-methylenetetrahydrofolate dehydrogenase/5,10-methenyltetrahydrofolate cyclohydrolase [Alicyclobacillus sendaiensis]|uniref:Bifunctional protein FolD n=1 Tax=Alicyclobacillus sendaiensis PA2 TaxID=3029425 RepID=A0ABT6XXV3_ALISE|nr:bifunctional 5,10-methylenetetrahydrofolate dehydrogenase/5,10-methenyltetrahydrofolate cyclohydrolase [Alicyclobacillus sendaiensis]MDI9259910.1 bifunctional 5,10-methylenetetrahydrofolate dehydrogenase/5,10-methenyltetrahydrofolate cyclohydrolase [Alicyclobacillus sendaiensis PA2]
MAQRLDGRRAAERVQEALRRRVDQLVSRGIVPKLVMLVSEADEISLGHVRRKARFARGAGLVAEIRTFRPSEGPGALRSAIGRLNEDDEVDAILVQLPLPAGWDEGDMLSHLRPDKDVDGLHPQNLGRIAFGRPRVWPCTARGIGELLELHEIGVRGKVACVIGRSPLVGWPIAQWFMAHGATVIQCHRQTPSIATWTKQADIVVSAAGAPGLVGAEEVRPGAVVIDVGITYTEDGPRGDVDPGAAARASWITPVPGGVGPMTVAMVAQNAVDLCAMRRGG